MVLLSISKAATPFIASEAEAGAPGGCVSPVTDSTASGGTAVKFSGCASGDDMSPLTLDETGTTIPDTNYAIPTGAIFMATTGSDSNNGTQASPVKTLNKAIGLAPSGGTVVLRAGVYHDGYDSGAAGGYKYAIMSKGVAFQAYPHEQVWLDGTINQPTANWTSDGAGHWSMAWSTPQFCDGHYYDYKYDNQPHTNLGPCAHYDINSAPEYPAAVDPQMVFIDNQQMTEVTSLVNATGGKFYYDWENKRIYISTNPSGHSVDLAVRTNALVMGNGALGYGLKGIGVRRYATNEASNITGSAVYASSLNITIENNVFTQNASSGLYLKAQGGTLRHNALVNNGNVSFSSNGTSQTTKNDSLMMEDNLVAANNTEHMGIHCTLSCGQAGIKLNHVAGYTLRNNVIRNNINASGFWCDQNCSKAVMVNNLIMNNDSAGIFYEISSDGIIASNMLINNKDGIQLASATTKVYNNTIVNSNSSTSMFIYDDDRWSGDTKGTDIGPDNYGIDVKNNLFYGGNVTTFLAMRKSSVGSNTGPNTYFSGLDYNSYYRSVANKSMIHWVDGTDKNYSSLSSFMADHAWEQHGQDNNGGTDPFFTDSSVGIYSVRPSSAAYHSATTIPDDVAAAIGITQKTGQSRGALIYPALK